MSVVCLYLIWVLLHNILNFWCTCCSIFIFFNDPYGLAFWLYKDSPRKFHWGTLCIYPVSSPRQQSEDHERAHVNGLIKKRRRQWVAEAQLLLFLDAEAHEHIWKPKPNNTNRKPVGSYRKRSPIIVDRSYFLGNDFSENQLNSPRIAAVIWDYS